MEIKVPSDNIVELIDGGDKNPYHLLFYMISNFRMIDYKEPVLYYYEKTNRKLVEELLALLPKHFMRDTIKRPDFEYRPFLHTTPFRIQRPFFPDWTLPYDYDFIREIFEPHYVKTIKKGLRIYISRNKDATYRRIVNEDELLNVLNPLGFITVTMSELSVLAQMNIFSQSDVIVSPHGAAMAFMVFASSDTTLIELNAKQPTCRHYSHVAWHLEMDYYKMICKMDETGKDLIVDVDRLSKFLNAHPKFYS